MLEGGGNEDKVKSTVFEQAGADIAMDKAEVRVVAEHACGLLEFGEIDVDAEDR
jgi:hypothetical protein